MKKTYRVHINLDIRVVMDDPRRLNNRKFKEEVIEAAFDELRMNTEDFCDTDNVAFVEIDKKTPYKPTLVWAFFNKRDERLYQYGMFAHLDMAQTVLRKAQEARPEAGIHLKQIEL